MADDLVGCVCSSLARLVGAVHEAVGQAQSLSAPSDVLPAAADAAGPADPQTASGVSATHAAAILLLLFALLLSFFQSRSSQPEKAARLEGAGRGDGADPPAA